MARLPGGLTVWRGRRLLGSVPAPRRSSLLSAVDAARHPALHSLVLDAVKYADVPPPAAVRLCGPAVVTFADGELTIGLPLIWGLSADQLRVVLAHELALPASRQPDLVRGLLNARLLTPSGSPATSGSPVADKAVVRHARLLAATEGLLAEAEQVRDAAAISAGGGGLSAVGDAALALLKAAAIHLVFTAFAPAEGAPVVHGKVLRVADLHAGWLLRLSRWGAPPHDVSALLGALPAMHPGLAAELRSIDGGPFVTVAADAVELDPLPAELERELAGEVLPDGDWTRFTELPLEVYLVEVERQARAYVEAVHEVLGRAPDGRDELAGTLLRRPVDVERARLGIPDAAPQAPPWMGAALLAVVAEYTLLKRGWRREHPLLARRLVGPDGALLDLNELVRSPADLRAVFLAS